jgi:glycosyltransferase involved in cell wall biosynthesis
MINLLTPIDAFTGYGISGYNIWKELYKQHDNLSLFVIGNGNIEMEWDKESLVKSISHYDSFNKEYPCVKIWHGHDFFSRIAGCSKYGGLSFFELDTISTVEKASYNTLDIIFAPSKWAKDVLENNGVKSKVVVCPTGVDTNIFDGITPEDKLNDKYIFINIGKWEVRKGHDVLVNIFNKAFTKDDNVELWMANHNPFLNEEQRKNWISIYKDSALGDKIRIYPRVPSQKMLSKIMAYTDCGIFPSRGEGWNNEAVEMMAMNKPIIITNCTAHTEYCNSDNSYLVNIDKNELANDGIWFKNNGNWAHIGDNQIDQMVEHMRYVYKNNIRSNSSGLSTARNLSWDKTAKIISSNIL